VLGCRCPSVAEAAIDVLTTGATIGTQVELWDCNGTAAQKFSLS
jgi:hypothetical protein